MNKKKIITIIVLLVIVVIGGVLIFNPPERVKGGFGGIPITPGASAYVEEYQCFGISRDFCPPWDDYGCDLLCYGIIHSKKCFVVSYDNEYQKQSSECR